MLTSITITEANYEEARDILKNRYQNLRAIVREHIAAIVNAPNVNKQETGSLRNLAQTKDEHRRALEALGQNTAEMDIFIVYHVVEKMDHESRRQWELEHPGTYILKYDDLNKFLTTRCRALEAAQASKQSNKGIDFGQAQSGGKRNHSLSVTQTSKCPQCKQVQVTQLKTVLRRRNVSYAINLITRCYISIKIMLPHQWPAMKQAKQAHVLKLPQLWVLAIKCCYKQPTSKC